VRKSTEPLTRHTILLTSGTYERLRDIYDETIGAAAVVRLLIQRHLNEVERASPKDDLKMVDSVIGGNEL
jgi:hypothetical protein